MTLPCRQPSQVDDLPGWMTLQVDNPPGWMPLRGGQPSQALPPCLSCAGLLPLAPAGPAASPVHDPSPSSGLRCWPHTHTTLEKWGQREHREAWAGVSASPLGGDMTGAHPGPSLGLHSSPQADTTPPSSQLELQGSWIPRQQGPGKVRRYQLRNVVPLGGTEACRAQPLHIPPPLAAHGQD